MKGSSLKNLSTYCLLFCLSFVLFACDTEKENDYSDVPAQIIERLEMSAAKLGNLEASKKWVDGQIEAYRKIEGIVPDIPLQDYADIKNFASQKYTDNFIEQHKFLELQIQAFKRVRDMEVRMEREFYNLALEFSKDIPKGDFITLHSRMKAWSELFNSTLNLKRAISSDAYMKLLRESYVESKNIAKVREYLLNQDEARRKFQSYKNSKFTRAQLDSIKSEFANIYPNNFIRQHDSLLSRVQTLETLKPKEKKKDVEGERCAKVEDVFRRSVLTKHGSVDSIHCAVIVKMKGKVVILCPKEFLQGDKLTFSDSRGKIVCSKLYVSKELPLILAIPDSLPDGFEPMEIIDAKDTFNVFDKALFAISPQGGGFRGDYVSVFSESDFYLNLRTSYKESVTRKTTVRLTTRYSNDMLIKTVDTPNFGEQAIVIDPETGKLVSMSLTFHEAGQIDWGGKTGSVLGHERSAIPDVSTFIREFDGSMRGTLASPPKSIRFLRLTALEHWESISYDKLVEQKNELRIFTDENNDFLQLFRRNYYGDSLRSRRLGALVEKYRKRLLRERLSRENFERYCRDYIVEMQLLVKRELREESYYQSFYSLYRNEILYQLRLRQAFAQKISEILQSNDVMAHMPLEVRTRYNDIDNAEIRMGPGAQSKYINVPK